VHGFKPLNTDGLTYNYCNLNTPITMYHYTESGLNNIYLNNGYQYADDSLLLEDRWNLHYVIACKLIEKKGKLSPKEFKYLRNEINATQATLANALGVCESTVRNWERGRSEISPIADRMIRLIYRSCADDKVDLIELVNNLSGSTQSHLIFNFTHTTQWHFANQFSE